MEEKIRRFTPISTNKFLSIIRSPDFEPVEPVIEPKKLYATYSWYRNGYKNLSPHNRKYVKDMVYEFLVFIRAGENDKAGELLKDYKFRMTIPDKSYDEMSGTLAGAYLLSGDSKNALLWSKKACYRSQDMASCWWGGLSAWTEKNYELSTKYFSELLASKNEDNWLKSAAAYWAYRSYIKLKNPSKARQYIKIAQKYDMTFYGILAQYTLSQKNDYDWEEKVYFNDLSNQKTLNNFLSNESIIRAILLLEIGKKDLAEADLKNNQKTLSLKQKELLLPLASQYELFNLGMIMSSRLEDAKLNRHYNSSSYPLPKSLSDFGWGVSPAFVLSLIRQESMFFENAVSHAGACGLMQIMPATAQMVTNDPSYGKECSLLFDKYKNLEIGQDYIAMLQKDDVLSDNIFFLSASYNAGPHNLKKWVENIDYNDDTLLFIELIPWRETRFYVKKIMTNYWIYSSRIGQQTQTIQQVIDGKWPLLDKI